MCLKRDQELSLKAFEVFASTNSSFRTSNRGLLEACWINATNQDDWVKLSEASMSEGWATKLYKNLFKELSSSKLPGCVIARILCCYMMALLKMCCLSRKRIYIWGVWRANACQWRKYWCNTRIFLMLVNWWWLQWLWVRSYHIQLQNLWRWTHEWYFQICAIGFQVSSLEKKIMTWWHRICGFGCICSAQLQKHDSRYSKMVSSRHFLAWAVTCKQAAFSFSFLERNICAAAFIIP